MSPFDALAEDFLAQKRIAVAGVSSGGKGTGNIIFKALRDRGYEVFPVNPRAETIDGAPCYASVKDLPGGVGGVVIVTSPQASEQIVHECVEAGIPRVWMHYNPLFGKGNSSASEAGAAYGREHGLTVIEGGCPLMFVDIPHKCMRWLLGVFKRLPA